MVMTRGAGRGGLNRRQQLTEAEREALSLAAAGATAKEIAQAPGSVGARWRGA